MDRTLQAATILGQSVPGSNDNEGVLSIPQSSKVGIRLFNVISGHSLRRSYATAEMQLVYSTAPADWAFNRFNFKVVIILDWLP